MTADGAEPSGAADVDERVVEFLRTADRPRHLASGVSEALGLARGRVRTRLQALADDGRVVRTDAERTARWAVPDRADEPEPEPGSVADDGPGEDVGDDAGDPDADAAEAADPGAAERPDENGEPATDEPVEGEEPETDDAAEDDDRTGREEPTGDGAPIEDHDRADASATAEGLAGTSDRSAGDVRPGSPGAASVEHGRRWHDPAVGVALLVGLAVAIVALGRLRRR